MRWSAPPLPKNRETRIFIKFAWYPIRMTDRTLVWLEKYEATHRAYYLSNGSHYWSLVERQHICQLTNLVKGKE